MLARILAFCALALAPASVEAQEFEVGQVWEYEARASDVDSLVLIQAIEEIGPAEDPMTVYHVSVSGIRIEAFDIYQDLPHTPISGEALRASVTRQVDADLQFAGFEDGLAYWRDANGGVFTITLAEIAEVVENSVTEMNQAR